MGINSVNAVSEVAPLRILIIGCGNIAGGFDRLSDIDAGEFAKTHAGAYRKHPQAMVVACVDPDIDKARRFAQEWGVDHHYATIEEAADQLPFDVISICAPTAYHFDCIQSCLALFPKVIFVEKPITSDVKMSHIAANDCLERGVHLIVNFSRRWDQRLAEFKHQLDGGQLGELRSVVAYYNKGILNNGSHMLDLLVRLLGNLKVRSSWLNAATETNSTQVEDPDIEAVLVSDKGLSVHLIATRAEDYGLFELEITTSKGAYRMINGGTDWLIRVVDDHPDFPGYRRLSDAKQAQGGYWPVMEAAIAEVVSLAQSPQTIVELPVALKQAINVQTLIEELIQSVSRDQSFADE